MKPFASLSWLSLLLPFVSFSLGDEAAFFEDNAYNAGEYGSYVIQPYVTTDIRVPRLNFMKPFTNCDDGSYIFIAPRGEVAKPTLTILDAEGSMIWARSDLGQVYNFQAQTYKGQQYLTFWAGNDAVGGHGVGTYYMLDSNYEEYKNFSAVNGLGGDLHAFTITSHDTALLTAYQPTQKDLTRVSRGRKKSGWIWDCFFQEMNIETGEVIFQWRGSDHVTIEDSYTRVGPATEKNPWDWFHINSVEKDALGNYLVSGRFLRAVLYIDGRTGQVLWQVGGKKNSFRDLSHGEASTFLGQHDAHWVANNTITLFDNKGDGIAKAGGGSRGKRIKLDMENMTAELEVKYENPAYVLSISQGSCQTLPNGNVLVGFGFNGVMTEFDAEGNVLCDAYFEPAFRWTSGDVQSYRDLKLPWTGTPKTDPAMAMVNGTLYMSWMGSTALTRWIIQDSYSKDGPFVSMYTLDKDGFETVVELDDTTRLRQYVRAVAVDKDGHELKASTVVDLGDYAFARFEELEDLDDAMAAGHGGSSDLSDSDITPVLAGLIFLASFTVVLLVGMFLGARGWSPWAGKHLRWTERRSSLEDRFERLMAVIPGINRLHQPAKYSSVAPSVDEADGGLLSDVELSSDKVRSSPS